MGTLPEWLPSLLCYTDYNGDWDKFLSDVYAIFERDFKKTRPLFRTLPVNHDTRIEFGKEAGFWHIVQKEEKDIAIRIPNLRRCEHIRWPKPLIENSSDLRVSCWQNLVKRPGQGRQNRISIWIEDLDYIVILRARSKEMILITAYCVIYESHRNKLRKQRDEYNKTKAAP